MNNNRQKNRILVISNDYLPTVGGSFRVLHELFSRIKDMEIEVITCLNKISTEYDKQFCYNVKRSWLISLLNENYYNHSVLRSIFHFKIIDKIFKYFIFPVLTMVFLIPKILIGSYSHIIFAQSVVPFSWYIFILNKISKNKILTFVYGEEVTGYRKKGKIFKYLRKQYLVGLKNADLVIANSDSTKNELVIEGIKNENIVIVFPALDYKLFENVGKITAKRKYGIQNNYVILTVAKLVRRKGHDTVLYILPELQKKIPNILYLIRGEGPDKQYLQSIIEKLKLSKMVRFIDDQPYEELPTIYSAADIYVMPNRLDEIDNEQEGFGIVFLEANSCGLPVIGGNSGGAKDVIKNKINGILIDPNNKEELLEKILLIKNDPTLFDPKIVRDYVKTNFNWEKSTKTLCSLFFRQ